MRYFPAAMDIKDLHKGSARQLPDQRYVLLCVGHCLDVQHLGKSLQVNLARNAFVASGLHDPVVVSLLSYDLVHGLKTVTHEIFLSTHIIARAPARY
jgi:hypothetical protein